MDKALIAALAAALTLVAFVPYLRSMAQGHTKPHVFSWVIWGVNTGVAFVAVLAEGGGAGAGVIGFSSAITLYVAVVAYLKRADVSITAVDWFFFISALIAMPLWWWMNDPLWAVILITSIELLGFAPTFRKCWYQPYSESIAFLAILMLRNALIVAALEHATFTTLLFPVAMAGACLALIGIMLGRRLATRSKG